MSVFQMYKTSKCNIDGYKLNPKIGNIHDACNLWALAN